METMVAIRLVFFRGPTSRVTKSCRGFSLTVAMSTKAMASAISTANSVLRKENRRSIVLVMSLDFLTALPMENTSHLLLAHGL